MHEVLGNSLVKLAQKKSSVRLSDHPDMTIAVDWDVRINQTKNILRFYDILIVLAGSDFCLLLITFANSLEPDHDRQNDLKLTGIILLCTHNICFG